MLCPIHNVEFKLVPAGVSQRTGKAYSAFYACPERGCTQKPPSATQKAAKASNPAPTASQVDKVDWDAKDRQSAMQTCIKAAADLLQGSGDIAKCKTYARQLYHDLMLPAKKGLLAKSDVGQAVQNAQTEPDPEDEIDLDSIPF